MITKFNRESLLVTLMGVMILFGLFYYGNQYLVTPLREEAIYLSQTVEDQEELLATYPPNEELLEGYEVTYAETEAFLPSGVQDTQAFITLTQLADQENVVLESVLKTSAYQGIEGASEYFMKNTYTAQVTSESPAALRNLIGHLMIEDRVWNIHSLTYSQSGEEMYTASFNFELAYYNDNPTNVEETIETEEDDFESLEGLSDE